MSLKEISELLINARRPIDVFGNKDEETIKKTYRKYARITHPDLHPDSDKELASRVTALLNEFYEKAEKELKEGIYYITDLKSIYKMKESMFEIDIKKSKYKFYEAIAEGDVSVAYYGLDDKDNEVILKYAIDESDNELIDKEYELLNKLDHISIPKVTKKVKIDGHSSLIMPKVDGITLDYLINNYGAIEDKHVAWILERMLSSIGYLHYNKIVHGNIKPENLIINPETHNVVLLDYSMCIMDANKSDAKYKIINDHYSPTYIESGERVIPHVDIYGVGKIAIELLGGDLRSNGMPISSNIRLRSFIRKMVNTKINDAWGLWDELIKIRNEEYGTDRFQKLELKKKVG